MEKLVANNLQLAFDKPWKNVTSGSEVTMKDCFVADFLIDPLDGTSCTPKAPVLKDTLALLADRPDDHYEVILGRR